MFSSFHKVSRALLVNLLKQKQNNIIVGGAHQRARFSFDINLKKGSAMRPLRNPH